MIFSLSNPALLGGSVPPIDALVIARKSVVLGEVLQFDLARTNGAVNTWQQGSPAGVFANVVAPTSGGLNGGALHCVALEATGADQPVRVRLQGIVETRQTGTFAFGSRGAMNTAGQIILDSAAVAGNIIRGICLDPLASGATGIWLFGGLCPFATRT